MGASPSFATSLKICKELERAIEASESMEIRGEEVECCGGDVGVMCLEAWISSASIVAGAKIGAEGRDEGEDENENN